MSVTISSPNYPKFFNVGDQCVWLLVASRGGIVFLQFIEQFQLQCEDTCDKSYVEIKTAADFRITGYRFCCSKTPTHIFQSATNEMVVIFRGFGDPGKGFKAKIWSDLNDPGNETTATEASLTTSVDASTISTTGSSTTVTTVVAITTTTVTITTTTATTTPTPTTTIPVGGTVSLLPVTSTLPSIIEGIAVENKKHSALSSTISVEILTTCNCGEWSEWTAACSQECGGCGKRSRARHCSSNGDCRTEEKRACGFKVCPYGTNFLINNGEFHILWKGCCVGLFRSGEVCSAFDDSENPFLKILETLLSVQDIRKSRVLPSSDNLVKQ